MPAVKIVKGGRLKIKIFFLDAYHFLGMNKSYTNFSPWKIKRCKHYWSKENVIGDFLPTCIHNICYIFVGLWGLEREKSRY